MYWISTQALTRESKACPSLASLLPSTCWWPQQESYSISHSVSSCTEGVHHQSQVTGPWGSCLQVLWRISPQGEKQDLSKWKRSREGTRAPGSVRAERSIEALRCSPLTGKSKQSSHSEVLLYLRTQQETLSMGEWGLAILQNISGHFFPHQVNACKHRITDGFGTKPRTESKSKKAKTQKNKYLLEINLFFN